MKIKWVLTGLAALVIAVVVAGYAVLSSMEFEGLREAVQARAKKATGRDLVVAGPIDLQVSFTPAIALEDITLANSPWGSRSEMVKVRRFELEVALLPLLSGDIQVKRLLIVEPDILLETDTTGRGNWVMREAVAEPEGQAEPGATRLPEVGEFVVQQGAVTYRDGRSGQETRVRLSDLTARLTGDPVPLRIALEGAYNDRPFKLEGAVGSFRQFTGPRPYPVKLRAVAGGATLALDGDIGEPMTGQGLNLKVQARGESLAELGALAGADLPPLGPFDLAARIERGQAAYTLTGLSAKIGQSDLAGNATVALGGPRPALSGSFTAATLSLADLAPDEADRRAGAAPGDGGRRFVFAEDPLPLAGLRAVDAKIKLSVERLRLRHDVEASDVEVSLVLQNGRLALKPFSLKVVGGRLAGELELDAGSAPPPVSLRLSAQDIDYGRLLKDRQITERVSGRLDASAQLRGAGASLRAIAAGLNGRIEVIGGQGRIRNDLLQTAGAGLRQMLSAWRESDSDLRLNCVVARLPVRDGVATSEAILLDTDAATVAGTGSVDLRSEKPDLKLTPQAKKASLMSLAVPFRIGGTLASPSIGPDPLGTAVGAARVAGLFINPLTVGAAIVLESETTEKNPCVAALERPAKGSSSSQPKRETTVIEDTAKGVGDALEGVGQGIGKGLKSLFGD